MYGSTSAMAAGTVPVAGLALDLAWIVLAGVMLLVVAATVWRLAPRRR